jgi:hypothetical protein
MLVVRGISPLGEQLEAELHVGGSKQTIWRTLPRHNPDFTFALITSVQADGDELESILSDHGLILYNPEGAGSRVRTWHGKDAVHIVLCHFL